MPKRRHSTWRHFEICLRRGLLTCMVVCWISCYNVWSNTIESFGGVVRGCGLCVVWPSRSFEQSQDFNELSSIFRSWSSIVSVILSHRPHSGKAALLPHGGVHIFTLLFPCFSSLDLFLLGVREPAPLFMRFLSYFPSTSLQGKGGQ